MYQYDDLKNHKKYRKQIDFFGKVYTVAVLLFQFYLWYRFIYLRNYFWHFMLT